MDERIIDIREHLRPAEGKGGSAFSVWGGEGERARFALPVWRSIFLLGGDRGGIFQLRHGEERACVPYFVLDLAEDPARTSFLPPPGGMPEDRQAPALTFRDAGEVLVFLGRTKSGPWYLEISGGREGSLEEGRRREEFLFLAGECAGLLFLRDFAGEGEPVGED